MGRHHFSPGGQTRLRLPLRRLLGCLPLLGASLLTKHLTLQALAERLDFLDLSSGLEGVEEDLAEVEDPVGLVGAEPLVVGPVVAGVTEQRHIAALRTAEYLPEEVVPGGFHPLEEECQVIGIRVPVGLMETLVQTIDPVLSKHRLERLLQFGLDPVAEQGEGFADSLMVGHRHTVTPPTSVVPERSPRPPIGSDQATPG